VIAGEVAKVVSVEMPDGSLATFFVTFIVRGGSMKVTISGEDFKFIQSRKIGRPGEPWMISWNGLEVVI